MNEGLIPRRYAKALYKYALESGKDAELYTLTSRIDNAFTAEPQLAKVIANPFVDDADKRKLLLQAAGVSSKDSVLERFISLLIKNKRIDLAWSIARAYKDIYRAMHKIHMVTVTSASELDAPTEKRVKDMIADVIDKQLGGGSMEYQTKVDPNLIGGFTVNIDNDKLDASVANELKQLKLKLLGK